MDVFLDNTWLNSKDSLGRLFPQVIEQVKQSLKEARENRFDNYFQRILDLGTIGILYASESVRRFQITKDLYAEGFFEPAIAFARTSIETLIDEKIEENNIQNSNGLVPKDEKAFLKDLGFKKKVHFLRLIAAITPAQKDKLIKLWKLCNNYSHPEINSSIETDAKKAVELLKAIIREMRTIFDKYTIFDGQITPKK